MAWIESHQALGSHRKLLKLRDLLGTSRPAAIGHLHLLWWWALDNAPDGNLSALSDDTLSEVCAWQGQPDKFVSALMESGFVNQDRSIHDWDQYAGRLITKRVRDRERSKTFREQSAYGMRTVCVPSAKSMRTVCEQNPYVAGTVPNSTVPNSTVPNTPNPLPPIPLSGPSPAPVVAGASVNNHKVSVWEPDPIQLRLGALFNRRSSTRWDQKELKAYRILCPIQDEDLEVIELYYKAPIPKETDYRRRDLVTLLNNWRGEIDRARGHFSRPAQKPTGWDPPNLIQENITIPILNRK